MVIASFPPVDAADENGLLAVGGDLEVDSLLLAYRNGIFPWPLRTDLPLLWFSPPKRAVVFLDEFHISGSLLRELKKGQYTIAVDSDFPSVITLCRGIARKTEQGTWITQEMVDAYIELHQSGHCHSIECYDGGKLVGGLYGVSIGKMFAGESMFYLKDNASKICLCFLAHHLKQHSVSWFDCQQLTPLLESFGAREIDRSEYTTLLEPAVAEEERIFVDVIGATFSATPEFPRIDQG